MLTLAAHARSTPESSFLLTAAHYLLLGGEEEAVAAFYPSVAGEARGEGDPYPYSATSAWSTRRSCGPSSRPAGCSKTRSGGAPSCSPRSGSLSRGWVAPWHSSRWGLARASTSSSTATPTTTETGGSAATRALRCACELRGDRMPPLPDDPPAVAWRVGLDLNPLDVRDPEAARWLEALIWPEEYAYGAPRLRRQRRRTGAADPAGRRHSRLAPRSPGGGPRGREPVRLPYLHPQPNLRRGSAIYTGSRSSGSGPTTAPYSATPAMRTEPRKISCSPAATISASGWSGWVSEADRLPACPEHSEKWLALNLVYTHRRRDDVPAVGGRPRTCGRFTLPKD